MTMKKLHHAILSALLAGILLFSTVTTVSADDVVRSTVNIADATKNQRGAGYYWANRDDVLTLDGLKLDTEEAFGIRLPKNCTVVLKGDNYIKAAKYGISCAGNVVFKGNGSLTIDAGEIGIYIITQDSTQKIRLIDGEYEINAGRFGVHSDSADFSFIGDEMEINVTKQSDAVISADIGYAVYGRCVNLLGGDFTANAPVYTTHELVVDGIDIEITADSSALVSKNLKVKNISVEYNGESYIDADSTADRSHSSIIFGDSVSGWVDYIILLIFASAIAAGIIVPVIRRRKKTELLYKKLEAEGYDVRR